ncbi:MAG: hydroxymethylbilane synthase [Flavipsychrobacter sp.]|nr:hydroxymethylbilane synthase [Flavipsychrobacter sp.]
MPKIRIGTRESELAVWQANLVKRLLADDGHEAELIFIKSEGDTDLKTPLYEIGVQGIFTRALDIALLNGNIDIAVHSMKDVPTQMPKGIVCASILKRASYKDLLVPKTDIAFLDGTLPVVIATSSIRRKAQWLNRYPGHTLENLRGNVNTRLQKVKDNNWNGAIFAAAGLERINLRPANAIELDWMLPAPAQGAIMVVCRADDNHSLDACSSFHDNETALCTGLERDFLRALMGGCATPISALAQIQNGVVVFEGNILSVDGTEKLEVRRTIPVDSATDIGKDAAEELLRKGGRAILESVRSA